MRYWGLILLAIPIILVIALLIGRPDIVRNHPLVFVLLVVIGIVIGFLLVIRQGPPPTR
jgi:hypothetical protein